MKKLDEVIGIIDISLDRDTIITYIEHSWIRPVEKDEDFYFEDIDIARIRLIHQLRHDMLVNDSSMDIILSLLDQLYGSREQLRQLAMALEKNGG